MLSTLPHRAGYQLSTVAHTLSTILALAWNLHPSNDPIQGAAAIEKQKASVAPHNLEAEEHVLGSILLDPQALGRVVPILGTTTGSFFKTAHQNIYAAMLRLPEKFTP